MSRLPRLHVAGGHYHVVLRGNHRETLFTTLADRHQFDGIVAEALDRCDARLHAFCWMTNHIHALIQIGELPLGELMQRIAMRYSRFRHRKLGTTGHLFERRYRAWLVDTDGYFLTLLRYIHWNPVKARLVTDPAAYRWSSHNVYLGLRPLPWVTTAFAMRMLGTTAESAHRAYVRLASREPPGPIEDVLAEPHPDDSRVLGTDAFLERLPAPRVLPQLRTTLDAIATAECRKHAVPLALVRSPSRQRRLTPVRMAIVRRALADRVASLNEAARYLGRTPSSLSELLVRHGV
jgi:REP-associated tyrosine transposase